MKQPKLFPTRPVLSTTDAAKQLRKAGRKNLADAFLLLWGDRLPEPEREYRFHPERRWRFDLAWPEIRVAVEMDGGVFIRGGHNRGVQISRDNEKRNTAAFMGWSVLVYTTLDLKKKPVQMIEEVERFIKARIGPKF